MLPNVETGFLIVRLLRRGRSLLPAIKLGEFQVARSGQLMCPDTLCSRINVGATFNNGIKVRKINTLALNYTFLAKFFMLYFYARPYVYSLCQISMAPRLFPALYRFWSIE